MQTYSDIPLCNWTGENISLRVRKNGSFEMYGYEFQVELINVDDDSELQFYKLICDGELVSRWDDDICRETSLRYTANGKGFEAALRSAVAYIANHY